MAASEVRVCMRAFLSHSAKYQRRLSALGRCILRENVPRNGLRASLCKVGAAGLTFATALPFVPTVNAAMWGTKKDTKDKPEVEEERVVKEADDLYDKNNYIELYELLVKFKDCHNDEILWRLARAACDMGKNASKSRHHEYMLEGFEYIKRALEINENNFACHKWYAILLNYTKTYEGTRARIESAYECKKHLEKAIELNPGDATTIHSLGYWCYLFAAMPWYQRKIASAFFATPPTSSYEEALKYFERAEEVSPNFFSVNLLYLAKTYYALGDKEKALHYATKTREYDMKTADDIQAHTEACQLLIKLGVKLDTKKDRLFR